MKRAMSVLTVLAFLAVLSLSAYAQKGAWEGQKNEPTERTFGLGEKIMGFDVPPPEPPNEESEMRVQYPGNASMNYRGVVFGEFHPGNTYKEEFAVDFGSAGIWVRDNTWNQITGLNPTWMISGSLGSDISDDELLAGFGTSGVWVWEWTNYPGNWFQVSGASAEGAFITDDDQDGIDEAYVDFGSLGLWRYEYSGNSWTQVSGFNIYNGLRMDTEVYGWEEACLLFPTHGVWRVYKSKTTGNLIYQQLTGTVTSQDDHASAKFTRGTAEDLVLDFGSLGLWLLKENDHSWHQIDTGSINRVREVYFIGNPDAELLILYNTSPTGLWMWNYISSLPGELTQLHTWTPEADGFVEPLDINGDTETSGDQEVAIDFGSNGLWLYDDTNKSFTQLSALDPEFMVAGDYWNHGFPSCLIVDFGPSYGLWRYNASAGSWTQLSGLSPDSGS